MRIEGSEGDPRSSWWCCGRDFGETEARTGLPFQGAAGHVLDKALMQAGLRREDAFVTNVVSARPKANVWEAHAPDLVALHNAALQDRLAHYKPALVLALGNEALRACVTGSPEGDLPGIEEARGYLWERVWSDGSATRVLGTIHPAAALRQWVPWRVLIDIDVKKTAAELRAGCPPFPTREVRVVTSEAEAEIVVAALLKAPRLAVDIENTRDRTLACCGFAAQPDIAWVFPAHLHEAIAELCESSVPKDGCNLAYDRYFLQRYAGISLRGHARDIQLQWHVLQPELAGQAVNKKKSKRSEKSLRFLASVFTREPFWKDYDFISEDDRYTLNARDCMLTLEIADRLDKELAA